MIEKILLDYLAGELSAPVYMEVPEDGAERFVTVEKTGSGRRDGIRTAVFAVRSHGRTLFEASELNEDVIEAVLAMPETEDVFRAELNGDYNYTDTATKRYRYQAVFEIWY